MPLATLFLHATIVMVIASVSNAQLEYSDKKIGPYKITIRRVDHCEDSGSKEIFSDSTKISKTGRNSYSYSTNVTTLIPLDDNVQAFADFAVWGNGGWRPHYFAFDFEPFCTTFRHYMPQMFNKMLSNQDVKDCPIPPGTYKLMNISVVDVKTKLPVMPYGVYRSDLEFMKNGSLLGCQRIYFDLLPRKP